MKQYTHIWLLVLLLMAAGQVAARIVNVSSASAINKTWSAGDTLILANGSYNNMSLTLSGNGTAANPIVLRAATPGSVTLRGSSNITINGSYIEVNGICFTGTYTGSNHIVQFVTSSSHCRLTESAIDSYNPSSNTKDYKWVSLNGVENRVDHCYFAGKNHAGTLLVVWLKPGVIPKHHIDNNYFGYRVANLDSSGKELNGQEIMRIGDSSTSMLESQCVVECNYFEHCDGEIEMISNKSCGNIYRSNTFYACAGTLTLRHGNGCTVNGNWFLGTNKSASGGVRIIGEDHTVINNYFQDLEGTNYRAALCIVRGKPNSELNEYFQVKNAEVSNNTFVHCKEAFAVNFHSSSECSLLAINTTIENNHVYNDASHKSNKNINLAQSGGSITWRNNLMNAGKYTNYTPASPAVITGKDARMAIVNTAIQMYEPMSGSALSSYKTTLPAVVVADIRGRQRPTSKLPGCSEITGTTIFDVPTAETSGPMWRHQIPTALPETVMPTKVRKFINNGQLIITTIDPQSGQYVKYNSLGQKL